MLQHDAAVTVDDALGDAGRAGGEQHPQRVLEVDGDGLEGSGRGHDIGVVEGVGQGGDHVAVDGDRRPHGRQSGADPGDGLVPVDDRAREPEAVRGDEHGRVELTEAGQRRVGGVVHAAGRPDRPEARGGEEGGDGLRGVGEVADDPVADAHACRAQGRGDGTDLRLQPGPGHDVGGGVLAHPPDRDALGGPAAEDVGDVVEARPGEPPRPGHHRTLGRLDEHRVTDDLSPDLEEVPDGAPEGLEVDRGPGLEVGVRREVAPRPLAREPGEGRDLGALDGLGVRGPHRCDGLGDGDVAHVSHPTGAPVRW